MAAAGSFVSFAATATPGFAQQAAPTSQELEQLAPKSRTPRSTSRVETSGIRPGACPFEASALRATIERIDFTGPNGGPLAPELQALMADISPQQGEQSIRAICDLRDAAQARLRASRYVASVQVPQQRLADGTLKLEIVTGRIAELRVRGDPGPYREQLKSRIERLKAINPLNEAEAERLLLLAGDIPGITVRLGLSPAPGEPGDLIGDLEVTYVPFRMLANVQNYNAPQLGRETGLVHTEFFGLTGVGDVTSLTMQSTFDFKEQLIGQIRHAMILDDNGTSLALRGIYARSRPTIQNLDLRTVSLIGGLTVSRPVLRSLKSNSTVSGGFEYALQRTRVFGNGTSSPLNRDRIAAMFVRLDGDTRKTRGDGTLIGSLSGNLELRKGLDILGATPSRRIVDGFAPTRFEGSSTATIVRGEIESILSPGAYAELFTSVTGQWSNRALLNYDEFAIGNQTIGRGYDPGSNTGDRAVGYTIEPRINFDLRKSGRGQLFGYYDVIHLWNLDSGSTERKRRIASIGGGVRMTLVNGVRAELTYSHPLDPPLLTGNQIRPPADRVLFSLSVQLVPFGF